MHPKFTSRAQRVSTLALTPLYVCQHTGFWFYRECLNASNAHADLLTCPAKLDVELLVWHSPASIISDTSAASLLADMISIKLSCTCHYAKCPCADPGGETGSADPLKNHKNKGFLSIAGPDPLTSQSYYFSIRCWAIIGTPAKHHLNGVPLAGR